MQLFFLGKKFRKFVISIKSPWDEYSPAITHYEEGQRKVSEELIISQVAFNFWFKSSFVSNN